jgi:hypothetical protein
MKWWFLFFLRGIALSGPYDTHQECVAALKAEMEQPIIDPGFDHVQPAGVCFQGIRPD